VPMTVVLLTSNLFALKQVSPFGQFHKSPLQPPYTPRVYSQTGCYCCNAIRLSLTTLPLIDDSSAP
jgi:hypothetical protein